MQYNHRKLLSLLLLNMVLVFYLSAQQVIQMYQGKEVVANSIVVKYHDPASGPAAAADLRAALSAHPVSRIPELGIEEWRIYGDLQSALERLNRIPSLSAFPNYVFKRPLNNITSLSKGITSGLNATNDSLLTRQWALHNDGSFHSGVSVAGADISAFDAWTITTGKPLSSTSEMIIAIYDDGVDFTHEDLRNNAWVNPGEDLNGNGVVDPAEKNGLDDDGNGYPDDFHGWSAIYNNNHFLNPGSFHGTHVAGIAGAEGNNQKGISGVTQKVKMISVMMFDEFGATNAIAIMRGYAYLSALLNKGINIIAINQSWGGTLPFSDPSARRFIQVMTQFAREHNDMGALWVIAAGNASLNLDQLPVYSFPNNIQSPNILVVGSTNDLDQKSPFSDFGRYSIDIGAPGSRIISTLPPSRGPAYGFLDGTSMAAPHVTGAIALAKSVFNNDNHHALISRVLGSADRNTAFNGLWMSGGRLNAYRAVDPLGSGLSGLAASVDTGYVTKTFADDAGMLIIGFINATPSQVGINDLILKGPDVDHFSLDIAFKKTIIEKGSAYGIPVKFRPDSSKAVFQASAVFFTSAGDLTIPLVGNAQKFPKIALHPTEANLGDVAMGDSLNTAFEIKNDGTAPLHFKIHQTLFRENPLQSALLRERVHFNPKSQPSTFPSRTDRPGLIQTHYQQIAAALAYLERTPLSLPMPSAAIRHQNGLAEPLWSDSLNEEHKTLSQWKLLSFGEAEGKGINWELYDLLEGKHIRDKDNVFLAGDFVNGYKNSTLAAAVTPVFNFQAQPAKHATYLVFDYAAQLKDIADVFYVNAIVDGEFRETLAQTHAELLPDGNVYTAMIDISHLAALKGVEFWFVSASNAHAVQGWGAYFDNISLVRTEAPYAAAIQEDDIAPKNQQTIDLSIKTEFIPAGKYTLSTSVFSDAPNGMPKPPVHQTHFRSSVGALSIEPPFIHLDSLSRDTRSTAAFNAVNSGSGNINYHAHWSVSALFSEEHPRKKVQVHQQFIQAARKNLPTGISGIVREGTAANNNTLNPRTVLRLYRNAPDGGTAPPSTSRIIKPNIITSSTSDSIKALYVENFQGSTDLPLNWRIVDESFGLGSLWKIINISDDPAHKEHAAHVGDPEKSLILGNTRTLLISPKFDFHLIPDSLGIFLEFDYSVLMAPFFDAASVWLGHDNAPKPQIVYLGSSKDHLLNDGQYHTAVFDISRFRGLKDVFIAFLVETNETAYSHWALLDNMAIFTRHLPVYVTPAQGTIAASGSQTFKSVIDAYHFRPGAYMLTTHLNYFNVGKSNPNIHTEHQKTRFSVANKAPLAVNDTIMAVSGDTISIRYIVESLLSNDFDPDGDEIQLKNATDPVYGAFKHLKLDSLRDRPPTHYLAPPHFEGHDSFTYLISDGFQESQATAHIKVVPNPRFMAGAQQNFTFLEDHELALNAIKLAAGIGGGRKIYLRAQPQGKLLTARFDTLRHLLTFGTQEDNTWGTETVKLYLGSSAAMFDSLQVSVVVVPVNDPPIVSFRFTQKDNLVTFIDESTDADDSEGRIVKWRWDFGDGQTSEAQHPTHVYSEKKSYTATLTATDNNNTSASHTQTIKVDIISAISDEQNNLPTVFALYPNYPNPFNPVTTLRYALPVSGQIKLRVYNALGQLIATPVKGQKAAGYHQYHWNASALPSGIYFYQLTATDSNGALLFKQTQKMMLLK